MGIVGNAGVSRKTMGILFLVIGALLVAYLSLMMIVMASDVGARGGDSGSKASQGEITNAEITNSEITDGGGYKGEIMRKEQFKRH